MTTCAVECTVNGRLVSTDVPARELLSDFLRHRLSLTGTHVGCEQGVCGSCTVLFDGRAIRSCLLFAVQAHGHDIVTIEGLDPNDDLHLREAFSRNHALQCGFCTPGFLVSAYAIATNPELRTDDEPQLREQLGGNLCRCTGYQGLVAAVLEVLHATSEKVLDADVSAS